jgi:hypothetical protein
MEQRHADVADVVGVEVHDHRHALAGHEQAPLRADHGLRRVGRPRGEDQGPDRVDIGLEPGVAGVGVGRERVGERGAERRGRVAGIGEAARRQHGRQPARDRGEQVLVAGLGDHEPAVGVLDVAQQVLVAAGVVEAHDCPADQRGAAERE